MKKDYNKIRRESKLLMNRRKAGLLRRGLEFGEPELFALYGACLTNVRFIRVVVSYRLKLSGRFLLHVYSHL